VRDAVGWTPGRRGATLDPASAICWPRPAAAIRDEAEAEAADLAGVLGGALDVGWG
jgi:hypothetical protein